MSCAGQCCSPEISSCPGNQCCPFTGTCLPQGSCNDPGSGDDGGGDDDGGAPSSHALMQTKLLKAPHEIGAPFYGDFYNDEWNWNEYDEFLYSEEFVDGVGIRFTALNRALGKCRHHGFFLERKVPNTNYDESLPGGENCDNAIHINHGWENDFNEDNIFLNDSIENVLMQLYVL